MLNNLWEKINSHDKRTFAMAGHCLPMILCELYSFCWSSGSCLLALQESYSGFSIRMRLWRDCRLLDWPFVGWFFDRPGSIGVEVDETMVFQKKWLVELIKLLALTVTGKFCVYVSGVSGHFIECGSYALSKFQPSAVLGPKGRVHDLAIHSRKWVNSAQAVPSDTPTFLESISANLWRWRSRKFWQILIGCWALAEIRPSPIESLSSIPNVSNVGMVGVLNDCQVSLGHWRSMREVEKLSVHYFPVAFRRHKRAVTSFY